MLRPARLLPPKRHLTPRSARRLSTTNRGLLPGAPVPTRTGLSPVSLDQLSGHNTPAILGTPPAVPGRETPSGLRPSGDGQSRTTWPLTTLTRRAGSGLGGGPATTAPLVILNWPPWQGQSMVPLATSLMMQPTCVQTALNALYWPRAGWVTTTLAAL